MESGNCRGESESEGIPFTDSNSRNEPSDNVRLRNIQWSSRNAAILCMGLQVDQLPRCLDSIQAITIRHSQRDGSKLARTTGGVNAETLKHEIEAADCRRRRTMERFRGRSAVQRTTLERS